MHLIKQDAYTLCCEVKLYLRKVWNILGRDIFLQRENVSWKALLPDQATPSEAWKIYIPYLEEANSIILLYFPSLPKICYISTRDGEQTCVTIG